MTKVMVQGTRLQGIHKQGTRKGCPYYTALRARGTCIVGVPLAGTLARVCPAMQRYHSNERGLLQKLRENRKRVRTHIGHAHGLYGPCACPICVLTHYGWISCGSISSSASRGISSLPIRTAIEGTVRLWMMIPRINKVEACANSG